MLANFFRRLKIPLILTSFTAFMYVDISETAFYINNLYHCNSKYANKGFWEKEYQDDVSQYDWYVRYEEIAPIINKFIHNNDNILQIGAGNSTLSEQLYMENYKQITNIDISSEVVSQMTEYYKEKNLNIKFFEMNMLNLTLPENCYDIVLDKAGSDVLLVGKKPFKTYRKFMIEIERVLKKDGKFIFITLFSNFPLNKVIDKEKFEVIDFICKEKYSILILKKK